ncbi:MAG: 50S ribosomal protein L9 [Pseudomonadota bacterium]
MQVILLERIEKLGALGDVVSVKPGYARNYLLPREKALRATEANKKLFEARRAQIEAENEKKKTDAEGVVGSLDGKQFVLIRSASESGQLYGSVSTRDIAKVASESGASVNRNQVQLDNPIKTLGLFPVKIRLHAEVAVGVEIIIARSADEAERIAAGENIYATEEDEPEEDDLDQFESDVAAASLLESEGETAEGASADVEEPKDA